MKCLAMFQSAASVLGLWGLPMVSTHEPLYNCLLGHFSLMQVPLLFRTACFEDLSLGDSFKSWGPHQSMCYDEIASQPLLF